MGYKKILLKMIISIRENDWMKTIQSIKIPFSSKFATKTIIITTLVQFLQTSVAQR